MKLLLKIGIPLIVLVAAGLAAWQPAYTYWKERNRPKWRSAAVVRGSIVSVRNSTGTVEPVLSVQIGSFVSGPIEDLFVDFNDEIRKGDLLAKIDPRIYEAAVAGDQASLSIREAEVKRVKAELQRATNDERRSQELRAENEDFISDSEMDQYRFNRLSLEAQLNVAEAAVKQAQANLDNSKANLNYTEIRSPVDGIVIDRKIDPGQTLAAQFQTPELFIVAPDMRKEMYIFASVDEADIGLIREAQERDQPVHFTVDAYPDELFEGTIFQIRKSSNTVQNVVTYPVVVSAANPDLKLLPGMTANLSFRVDERNAVLKIPNSALRFYPPREHVREEDRKLLEGTEENDDESSSAETSLPADEKAKARRERVRRHVWIEAGEQLRAVEVVTGLSDFKFTELVSGDLKEEQKLVIGIETPR